MTVLTQNICNIEWGKTDIFFVDMLKFKAETVCIKGCPFLQIEEDIIIVYIVGGDERNC